MMSAAAHRQSAPGAGVSSAMSVTGTMLSPFAFVFFTPAGLISTYLAGAGLVRVVAAIVNEPIGDPLLTGLHRLAARLRTRRAAAVAITRRTALEGAEIPDRVLPGAEAGLPAAAHVVVAARRKPGWEEGVLVVTGLGWFRIGRIFEEYHDGGLRTLYPLLRSPESEVLRRAVHYALPGEKEAAASGTEGSGGAAVEVDEREVIPLSEDPLDAGRKPPGGGSA